MLVLAKSELEIQQQKEKHLAVTLSVVIVQIFDERINKPEIKEKNKSILMIPIMYLTTARTNTHQNKRCETSSQIIKLFTSKWVHSYCNLKVHAIK